MICLLLYFFICLLILPKKYKYHELKIDQDKTQQTTPFSCRLFFLPPSRTLQTSSKVHSTQIKTVSDKNENLHRVVNVLINKHSFESFTCLDLILER